MTDNSTDSEVQATDKGHADSGESGTGSGTDVAYGGTAACSAPQSQTDHLMERIVHRDNLNEAYRISLQLIRLNKNRPELAAGIFLSDSGKMKISGSEKTPTTC